MSTAIRLAVLDRIGHYAYAVDEHDEEAYLDLFTEQAELSFHSPGRSEPRRFKGREVLRQVIQAQFAHRRGQTRHQPSATVFDSIEERVVHCRTVFQVTQVEKGAIGIVATGRYDDHWVLDEEEWRLSRRAVHLDVDVG